MRAAHIASSKICPRVCVYINSNVIKRNTSGIYWNSRNVILKLLIAGALYDTPETILFEYWAVNDWVYM